MTTVIGSGLFTIDDHYDHYDYTDDVKDIHWFMLPLKNVSLVLRQRGCVHVNDTIAWSSVFRHGIRTPLFILITS